MKDGLEKKIAKCMHPDIISALIEEDHEEAQGRISEEYSKGSFFGFEFLEGEKGEYAYVFLLYLLWEEPMDLKSVLSCINWEGDYVAEYIELSRILAILFMAQSHPELRVKIADFLKYFAIETGHYIHQQANNYPLKSINAKVWADGAALRLRHHSLANYFEVKKMIDDQLEVLFAIAKITTSIMSHYPESVGPDMTAVAWALERKGDIPQAIKFYRPVLADFVQFLEGYEYEIQAGDFELERKHVATLDSLRLAVRRLMELADYQDTGDLIGRIKVVLAHRA